MLAVQKHAQLHRVAKAARFLVDPFEDYRQVRPIVNAAKIKKKRRGELGLYTHRKLAANVFAIGVHNYDVTFRGSDRFDVNSVAIGVGLAIGNTTAFRVTVR